MPDEVCDRIAATGASISADPGVRAEASRDWWPLTLGWALDNTIPARAALVVRPDDAAQVPEILAACAASDVPVTPVAGRSGVCGAAVPIHGGIALDLTP